MADSTSTPSSSNNAGDVANSSCFQRTVCLYDWWLVKAEDDFQGKRLAISGITSRKEEAVRVFVSAPVTKRYDLFSLETADGIYIIIKGFINEQRTLENGFPPEVFNNFIFGFPPNWESYAADWFRDESTTGIDWGSAVPKNVSTIGPEISSAGVEKSVPTSLKSLEEASGAHEKPFPEVECLASKENEGGVNVAHGCGSNRRSTRLHNIKVCQQKNPASGVPPKHPEKDQHSSLGAALENPDGEGLRSPVTPVQSQSLEQVNTPSEQLVKTYTSATDPGILSDGVEKSIPTSLKSPEEALGAHEKPFPEVEWHVSKESAGGVNVAHGCGSNRCSTRLRNIKVCQQKKPASGVPQKHSDKEQHSTLGTLENRNGEGLRSPVTPVQSQLLGQVNTPSEQIVKNYASAIDLEILSDGVEKFILTSKSPEEASGAHEKPFPEVECHASKENTGWGGVNVAHGYGSHRRSTRLCNIKVCQQRKPALVVPSKHPDKQQHSSLGALENPDGKGLKSPVTPVQLQPLGQVNTPSEQIVKNSASRVSSCSKRKKVTVETKVVMPKRKMARSASAVKYPRERDVSPLIKGGKEKISSVSPRPSSFKKSRSGRLLLPPLEFWRNQIPIYNADHEITEIQEGPSVVSPFKGSSPSLSRRSNNQKRAA